MKRIILISLVSLALFGCEEKKVTEEMLIGDWECNVTQQVAKWKNGGFQDFGKAMESKIKLAFFKENGVFMVKESNRQNGSIFNLKSYYDNIQSELFDGVVKKP